MATATKTAAKRTAAPKTGKKTAQAKTAETPDVMSFSNGAELLERAKDQFETMFSSFTGDFDEVREQAEELAEATQERFKTVQDCAAKTNACLMEAAQDEMAEAVQFATDIGQARSVTDLVAIQQAYFAKLFETRMERARELTETTVEAARESLKPVELPFANLKVFEKFFAFPVKS